MLSLWYQSLYQKKFQTSLPFLFIPQLTFQQFNFLFLLNILSTPATKIYFTISAYDLLFPLLFTDQPMSFCLSQNSSWNPAVINSIQYHSLLGKKLSYRFRAILYAAQSSIFDSDTNKTYYIFPPRYDPWKSVITQIH